jgi:hypothetical protein
MGESHAWIVIIEHWLTVSPCPSLLSTILTLAVCMYHLPPSFNTNHACLHFGLRIPAFSRLYLCLLSSTLPIHLLCQYPAPIRRRLHEHEHSDYNRGLGFDRMHSEGLESEASMSGSESGSPERNQAGPSKRKSTFKGSVQDGQD